MRFSADRVHRPSSIPELQDVVAAGAKMRVLGTGHSFNRIADTDGVLVSVRGLAQEIAIDAGSWSVTVAGGVRYAQLAEQLHASGLAVPVI